MTGFSYIPELIKQPDRKRRIVPHRVCFDTADSGCTQSGFELIEPVASIQREGPTLFEGLGRPMHRMRTADAVGQRKHPIGKSSRILSGQRVWQEQHDRRNRTVEPQRPTCRRTPFVLRIVTNRRIPHSAADYHNIREPRGSHWKAVFSAAVVNHAICTMMAVLSRTSGFLGCLHPGGRRPGNAGATMRSSAAIANGVEVSDPGKGQG